MYTEVQMNQILAQVESEFSSLLNKAEEEASVETPETTEEVVETPEVVENTEETAEVSEEVETPEVEETAEVAEEVESHDYTDEDIQEVEGLYADMDKSEAEIHYKALKKAMGADIAEEVVETPEVEEVAKNEETAVETEEVEDLNKAEILAKDEKIAEQSEKIEKMEKTIGDLTQALSSFLGKKTAKRKAVTGLNYQTIAKTEEGSKDGDIKNLTKSEINAKLTAVAGNPATSSQDRNLINEFYCNNGSVESIGHLLK